MEIVAGFYWLYKDSIDTLSVKYYKDEQISRQDLLLWTFFSHTATSIFHNVKSKSTSIEFIHVSYDSYVIVSLLCLAQSQVLLSLLCVILWFMFASVLCLNSVSLWPKFVLCIRSIIWVFVARFCCCGLFSLFVLYFRCAVYVGYLCVLWLFLYCRLFCCVLIYCCITVLFLLHLKTVSFSTLVMLCIHVPPLFCEVNLMHLTQTLSPSVSLPPSLIFSSPTSSFLCHKLN